MWKNYIKIAWRNLLKKKVYSLINIIGLGIGMACCALIFMFVQDELSYDNYHENKDRIFRVVHGSLPAEGGQPDLGSFWVWGNAPIGPALKNDFPEIEKVVQFSGRADILLTNEERIFQEEGVLFMDSTVFDVFSWELIQGDPKTALTAPFSIVLTESTSGKYFGDEDPIGKTLKGSEAAGRSDAGDYTVTGIMADVPSNSHFRFNALLSMSTFQKSRPDVFDNWGYVDFYTYFLVNEQFNETSFNQKIPGFITRRLGDSENRYTIAIEPLSDVYLKTIALRQPGETGSLSNIYIFSLIGLFILVIAMINFMNLSTARSMERAKEVGIRKSIGADRKSLIFQFLGESLIIVFLAALVAVIFVSMTLPVMTGLAGNGFLIQNLFNWQTILSLCGVMLVIGFLAGSYPALVLSGFKPVMILKGINKSGAKGISLRKGLVVFQFSLSIALITGTIIVYSQMNHVLDKDMGFDKEQMLVLDYNYDGDVNDRMDALKTEFGNLPEVLSATASRSVPGSHFPNAGTNIESADGIMMHHAPALYEVDMDFISHFNLEMAAGRPYSRDYPADSSHSLVINEAAAQLYGYANPQEIIGKRFAEKGKEGKVIGVVKDFNYTSLHLRIEPLVFWLRPSGSRYLTLKVKSENLPKTIAEVEQVWKELAPHRPFLYSFLNEDFDRQYQSDLRFRKVFTSFSVLAILIACLGLLGLAAYTAEQRTKEIGIRKVLGAGVSSIIALLSKDFIKLVIVAIIIATPISWYAMNRWLEDFAYRVEVDWWTFPLAGIIAITVALLTICSQTIKAAVANPVDSLRSE